MRTDDAALYPAAAPTDRPPTAPCEAGSQWAARVRSGPVYAAIDLGTNNCRLLVARPGPGGFRVVDAFSRIVRLGEGVSASRRLCDDAIERAMEALTVCGRKMARRGVTVSRSVATEACRRALNGGDFLARVRAETGIALEIITPDEEGRLALAGSAALLDRHVPEAIVFDIGGGSTELMYIRVPRRGPPRVIDQISIPCGVVSLAERFGGVDVTPDAYDAMIEDVRQALCEFEARNAIAAAVAEGRVQMLGTSGTVTTLAGIHMKLPRYDRNKVDGTYLSICDARRVSRDLLGLDLAGRAAQPCIGRDRADLVLAGCAVLEAIVALWPVEHLRIADRGLREGILVELIAADGRRP
jgi:exopolyphosphatase / guanosine-5'-triphosphate,3'-diphosphate pyrophosphatase